MAMTSGIEEGAALFHVAMALWPVVAICSFLFETGATVPGGSLPFSLF